MRLCPSRQRSRCRSPPSCLQRSRRTLVVSVEDYKTRGNPSSLLRLGSIPHTHSGPCNTRAAHAAHLQQTRTAGRFQSDEKSQNEWLKLQLWHLKAQKSARNLGTCCHSKHPGCVKARLNSTPCWPWSVTMVPMAYGPVDGDAQKSPEATPVTYKQGFDALRVFPTVSQLGTCCTTQDVGACAGVSQLSCRCTQTRE